MAAAGRIDIDLMINDQAALSGLKNSLNRVETQTRDTVERMDTGFLKAAAAVGASVFAVHKLVGVMQEAIKAASEGEDAVQRLNTALRLQGFTSKLVTQSYQEMASVFQATTRFSDDAILSVQQKLITLGDVGPASMKRVTQATIDLASALKIDLEAAGLLVARAAAGETSALSRYGLAIDQNLSKGQRFAALLELIEGRMGGSAQADVQTFTGAQEQLANAYGEVLKAMGNFVVQSPEVQAAMRGMSKSALELAKSLNNIRENDPHALMNSIVSGLNSVRSIITGGPAALGFMAGNSLAARLVGTPEEAVQAAKTTSDALNEEIAKQQAEREAAQHAHQQRLKDIDNFFKDSAVQSLIADTETGKMMKLQETEEHIRQNQARIASDMQVANLDAATQAKLLQYKQALGEAEKNADKAKRQAQLAALKAQFQTQLDMAQATSDLINSVATLSGKSSIKAVAIVLQAVVTAVNVMLTTINPFLALLKIATTAVSAASALSQLSQAEKALEASKSQSVQAVTTVPGFAGGVQNFRGGLALVGEQGPELVNLPGGSDVIPNNALGGLNISIVINNPIMTTEEATRSIARQIASNVSEFLDDERRRL